MHKTQRPAKDGPRGPKNKGRPADPCRPTLHLPALVPASFSVAYNSIYFLSLPTLLETTKLGRVRFRLSFSQRSGALFVGSIIGCSS
jgi:hypothetical protein